MGLRAWLLGRRKKFDDTNEVSALLEHIYSKKITGRNTRKAEVLEYIPTEKRMKFKLKSPVINYTNEKIDEVTTTLHVFVLGELAYVFIYFLVRDRIIQFVTPEEFIHLADNYKLKFSGINLRLVDSHQLDEAYIVELQLKKEIARKEIIKKDTKKTTAISITDFVIENAGGEKIAEGLLYNSAILKEEKIEQA
ncbi:MAG: hypothetical protein AAB847_01225 [Patescibacteria group bacterium]